MKIGVLTSGGDAPGMNAAIRAVVRCGIKEGHEIYGVKQGFRGLVNGLFSPMGTRDVSHIIQLGGTILGSARLPEFMQRSVQDMAIERFRKIGGDALIVIGGNGSQSGAAALSDLGLPVVGIASTIDNDLVGSDPSLGMHTAANVALEAIGQIKTTASSHQRAFVVETMGRDFGCLALAVGVAGGAEAIVIPEREIEPEILEKMIQESYERGKSHVIVVVAEGAKNNADRLAGYFDARKHEMGFSLRITKLGYVQRGGAPVLYDRLLGTRLGVEAIQLLTRNQYGCVVGVINDQIVHTPYLEITGKHKEMSCGLLALADMLSV